MDHRSAGVFLKRTDFVQFFVRPAAVSDRHFYLENEEAHHAIRVMRKRVGDTLCAADGCGNLYEGRIESVEPMRVCVEILKHEVGVGEPRMRLILAAAPPKGDAFDWVVEKGTELGVAVFQPLITQRTIIEPQNRLRRWRQKALSAMKQCGRSVLPEVREPVPFAEFCLRLPNPAFIAHEEADTPLHEFAATLRLAKEAAVLIGPEGGFTDEEIETAMKNGAEVISLGPRRLRSETAALAAVIRLLAMAEENG